MAYKFVVLEGIDGCGKATQCDALVRALRKLRQPVAVHKYPTEEAKKVHEHLEGKRKTGQDELFDAFIEDIRASQARLSEDLKKGWVIADRYAISTAAYQGAGGKLAPCMAQIENLKLVKPDVVIWLDLPIDEAMRRKAGQKKPDAHESDKAFLEEVRKDYAELYRRSFLSAKWHKIDASQPVERIAREIWLKIEGGQGAAY
ncbi:MAG: dTMP kinase [Candidatus Micrarchaeota archaeon]